MPAATGPPRTAAATTVANDTDTSVPAGSWTGSALAMRVIAVQKPTPIQPWISDGDGEENHSRRERNRRGGRDCEDCEPEASCQRAPPSSAVTPASLSPVYQDLRLAPPAKARVIRVARAVRRPYKRCLNPLMRSSPYQLLTLDRAIRRCPLLCKCLQPTHSGDGTVGCTTCSPPGPSAHVQPADRSSQGSLVRWYRSSTLVPDARYSRARPGRSQYPHIQTRGGGQISIDGHPDSLGPRASLQTAVHQVRTEVSGRIA